MHKKYNHLDFEKKWQDEWKQSGIYNVGERDLAKEKEYVLVEWPYPSGDLHIGHWFAFSVVDIYVRTHRMQGKQVFFPIGFDAFGLPAENAAIKRNINPKDWTDSNMEFMKSQLDKMGNAFSWNMTTNSTDPEYYKWTQWIFTQFLKHNIAYRGNATVNWCPGCNTVIANEQVTGENTCERSGDVVEKRDMPQWMLRITNYANQLVDDLDALNWPEHIKESQRQWIGRSKGAELTFTLSTGDCLPVFTTRADTLFGATYVVLAPEHELVQKNKDNITNWNEIAVYIAEASQKDEIIRTKAEREKTGVELLGITATNPGTGKQIPVYIADYVLKDYGTGAIMAVPAHDERDFAFATKFNLPIVQVVEGEKTLPFASSGILMNSQGFDGFDSEEAKSAITQKVGGLATNTFRLRDWSIGRQRYWGVPIPVVYSPEGEAHPIPEEHLPWHLPTDVDFKPTGEAPLAKSQELKERVERIFGKGWTPEVETMDTFVDSSWYFLRYIDNTNDQIFSSLQKQNELMPVDIYFGGAEHNTMHLLYSRFWQKALFELGLTTENEPYKVRINRGIVLGPDGNKMSKSKGNVINPDEHVQNLGADTVRMYLGFMGPYGEMANYPWDMGGIAGVRRFLERVFGLDDHLIDTEEIGTTKLLHKTIQKITNDISAYKFNTAISALMIFINHAEKNGLTLQSYKTLLVLLAPFAPHLSEELWHTHGEVNSIHLQPFPVADPLYLVDESVTLSVQIDGKMRGTITVMREATEGEVLAIIREDISLQSKITNDVIKIIYVPGRIINLILKKEDIT